MRGGEVVCDVAAHAAAASAFWASIIAIHCPPVCLGSAVLWWLIYPPATRKTQIKSVAEVIEGHGALV